MIRGSRWLAKTGALRIRKEPSADAAIYDLLEEGAKYEVVDEEQIRFSEDQEITADWVAALKDNPMRLCCISKSMYFDMADAMDTTTICIERNLRTFIAKLWKTDNHRYLDKIAGRHLVSKPTNKAFLDMMRLYWCEGDEDEE